MKMRDALVTRRVVFAVFDTSRKTVVLDVVDDFGDQRLRE
jgi:hypothetical protein